MNCSLRNDSFYNYKRGTTHTLFSIILLFLALGDQKANAETIWVESRTQILYQIEAQPGDGGNLTVQLLDDLNQPLSGESLTLVLTGSRDEEDRIFQDKTDATGNLHKSFHLPPDSYRGYIEYSGSEYQQPTRQTLNFEVTRCRQTTYTDPEFPLYIPTGEPISFDLKRQSCLQHEAMYMVSASAASTKQAMNPGETTVHVEFNPHQETPKTLNLEISLAEGDYLEPEVLRKNVIYYDVLFAEKPRIISAWNGLYLSAQLAEGVEQITAGAVLKDSEGRSYILQPQTSERGKIAFALPPNLEGCYETRLFRQDLWPQKGEFKGELCFASSQGRYIPAIIGIIVLALILLIIHFYPKTKRVKLPKSPEKTRTEITSVPRFRHSSQQNEKAAPPPSVLCVDSKTGVQLLPEETVIIQENQRFHPDKWPFELKENAPIRIEHANYLPWRGRLRRSSENTIKLQSRRDYIIECFEAVSAHCHLEATPWGHETPTQLASLICSKTKDEHKKELAKTFSELVSSAVFDQAEISDKSLREIRDAAKRLASL